MRPYTARMTTPLPFTMIGSSLAVVEESRHPGHQQGSHIVILAGWVERGVVNPDTMGKVRCRYRIDIYRTDKLLQRLLFLFVKMIFLSRIFTMFSRRLNNSRDTFVKAKR